MVVSGFGVKLVRLTEKDLELVRTWRNSPEIAKHMSYREYITPEMQQKWFQTINNIHNFYFIIHYRKKKIGVVNSKNIDWENKTSEGGMFIWDEKFIHSYVPILASLNVIESAFYFFNWKKSYIHILKGNQPAIEYARSLGYELSENQEELENQIYVLTRDSFLRKTKSLKKALSSLYSPSPLFSLLLEPDDYRNGIAEKLERELLSAHPETKLKVSAKGKYYYTNIEII